MTHKFRGLNYENHQRMLLFSTIFGNLKCSILITHDYSVHNWVNHSAVVSRHRLVMVVVDSSLAESSLKAIFRKKFMVWSSWGKTSSDFEESWTKWQSLNWRRMEFGLCEILKSSECLVLTHPIWKDDRYLKSSKSSLFSPVLSKWVSVINQLILTLVVERFDSN